MKILFVNKFLFPNGGSETYIFKLGDYLKSLGHDVEYFGMEHERRCVSNNVNSYTSNMDFHGSSKIDKLMYPFKIIYSFEARKKIRAVLDDFKPDVIHLNNFNYQLTPSIILEIKKWEKENNCKSKIIYTAHDYQLLCPNHSLYCSAISSNCEKCIRGNYTSCIKQKCIHNSVVRSVFGAAEGYIWKKIGIYKNIDNIICCSNFMKKKMDKVDDFKDKTIVLHNFIDVNNSTLPLLKEDYILYFGRFSVEKGVRTLIDVCKELPHVKFVFAGSGPLDKELMNLNNVVNLGFLSGDALNQVISKALISLCPSECNENCPFSVMESQTLGTPVIGANIGGIPELIHPGVTGELFESGNKEELKNKITFLLSNRDILSEYSDNCKKQKFDDISTYTTKLLKIYN